MYYCAGAAKGVEITSSGRLVEKYGRPLHHEQETRKRPVATPAKRLRELAQVRGNCDGDVLFGEYLHAFEDTFGHRDENNVPIQINSDWGHATSGHAPDHTYNEDFTYKGAPVSHNWQYNQARTLEMEKEVFEKLTKFADGKNNAQTWDTIKDALIRFNAVHEDSAGTDHFAAYPSKKIDILNVRLNEFGYRFVGMDGNAKDLDLYDIGLGAYNKQIGRDNRSNLLRYNKTEDGHKAGDAFKKDDSNFKGVILP